MSRYPFFKYDKRLMFDKRYLMLYVICITRVIWYRIYFTYMDRNRARLFYGMVVFVVSFCSVIWDNSLPSLSWLLLLMLFFCCCMLHGHVQMCECGNVYVYIVLYWILSNKMMGYDFQWSQMHLVSLNRIIWIKLFIKVNDIEIVLFMFRNVTSSRYSSLKLFNFNN